MRQKALSPRMLRQFPLIFAWSLAILMVCSQLLLVQHLVDPFGHPFGQLVGLLAAAFDARGVGGDALLGGVGVQAAQLAEGCGRQAGRPGVDRGVDRPARRGQGLAHLRGPGLAWTSTSRACTRSNGPAGGSSMPTSWRSTSKAPPAADIHVGSMSLATTRPVGATCSARAWVLAGVAGR